MSIFKKVSISASVICAAVFGAWADIMPCHIEMERPIVIRTFDELLKIGKDPCYTIWWDYELGNDIDASPSRNMNDGRGFEPIHGKDDVIVNDTLRLIPFRGIFDGKGYAIRGLYINRSDENNIGLFWLLGNGAEIKNLGVVDAEINGGNMVGGIAGANFGGHIFRSYVTGRVEGRDIVGGLVGISDEGIIEESFSSASVIARGYETIMPLNTDDQLPGNMAGGLAGLMRRGRISNSYATGYVSADTYAGGLAGFIENTCPQCYDMYYAIENSYATGITNTNVGALDVIVPGGGLVGGVGPSEGFVNIANSYWDVTTSGTITSAGEGGVGLTSFEMRGDESTYPGWDFENVWRIFIPEILCQGINDPECRGTYPYLRWQNGHGGGHQTSISQNQNQRNRARANSAMPQVSVRGRSLNILTTSRTSTTSNTMQVRMIDIRGRVVLSRNVDAVGTRHTLSLQKIPAGRYIVEIRNNNRRIGTSPIVVR